MEVEAGPYPFGYRLIRPALVFACLGALAAMWLEAAIFSSNQSFIRLGPYGTQAWTLVVAGLATVAVLTASAYRQLGRQSPAQPWMIWACFASVLAVVAASFTYASDSLILLFLAAPLALLLIAGGLLLLNLRSRRMIRDGRQLALEPNTDSLGNAFSRGYVAVGLVLLAASGFFMETIHEPPGRVGATAITETYEGNIVAFAGLGLALLACMPRRSSRDLWWWLWVLAIAAPSTLGLFDAWMAESSGWVPALVLVWTPLVATALLAQHLAASRSNALRAKAGRVRWRKG